MNFKRDKIHATRGILSMYSLLFLEFINLYLEINIRKARERKKTSSLHIQVFHSYLFWGLQELIDKILKLEAHNEQLKALLSKATNSNNLKEKATTEKIQKPFNFSR